MGHRCRRPLHAANINFTGNSFSPEKHIVSWFDLATCSKVIENGAIGQNAYDFLLVFYLLPFLRYSPFYAEMILLGDCNL